MRIIFYAILFLIYIPCACAFPPGAQAIGCNSVLFDFRPMLLDVSPDGFGEFKLYSGNWWDKYPYTTKYLSDDDEGALIIGLNGSVASTNRASQRGVLPLLSGQKSFYVEFDARISSRGADHWPALWLMPVEHDAKQSDHFERDPDKFERWLEIDIDEGGFSSGTHGVAISWSGIWPNYVRKISKDPHDNTTLDRTIYHQFGISFDSSNLSIEWWLDGKRMHKTNSGNVPEISRYHNYYLIMSAQSHSLNLDYNFLVKRVYACASF